MMEADPVESEIANIRPFVCCTGGDATRTIFLLSRTRNGAERETGQTDRPTWADTQRPTGAVASTTSSVRTTSRPGPINSVCTIAGLIRPCIALATTGKELKFSLPLKKNKIPL